jgi:hypothetical protein
VEVVKTNAVLGLGVLYTLDPAPTQDMILAHSPPSIIRSIEAHLDRESVQPDKFGRPLPPDPFCIASSQQLFTCHITYSHICRRISTSIQVGDIVDNHLLF